MIEKEEKYIEFIKKNLKLGYFLIINVKTKKQKYIKNFFFYVK